MLRNCQTAFALLVLLSPTIALCEATAIEPLPQELQPAQTQTQIQTQTKPLAQPQSRTPTPAAPQKALPEAPSSAIIDPNEVTVCHPYPLRRMGVITEGKSRMR